MPQSKVVNAKSVLTLTLTIPVSGAAVTILSLVQAQLTALGVYAFQVRFWQIMPRVAAGTDRAAFLLGHSAAAMNSHYAAGAVCRQSCWSLADNFVSSTTAGTVAAVIEVSAG